MKVEFLDLKGEFLRDKKSFQTILTQVLNSGHFILGENVKALEEKLAAFCDTRFAVGVASGSDALWLALLGLEVGPGDEVITTPYTFIATVTAIIKVGARPVFVDIENDGFSIDPHKVSDAISSRTRAMIPVHLFGLCAPMDDLTRIAQEKNITIVEDAAQALGSRLGKSPAGSMGKAAALSFYPTKNLGGAGDGGMVVTNDEALARQIQMLRGHGASKKYFHEILGWNSRLDEIQAAILLVRLKRLKGLIESRRKIAKRYLDTLSDLPLRLPCEPKGFFHTYNQFVICTDARDALRDFLSAQGIGTEIYYPLPLHVQPSLSSLGYGKGDFPHAERAAEESLALPIFPLMKPAQVKHVIKSVRSFFKRLS